MEGVYVRNTSENNLLVDFTQEMGLLTRSHKRDGVCVLFICVCVCVCSSVCVCVCWSLCTKVQL